MISNFRRKKILETLQSKKLSKDKKNEILEPYEDYIERVLQQYHDHYEFTQSEAAANEMGLDLKRLDEEESQLESDFKYSEHKSKKDPFGIKTKQVSIEELKNKIHNRKYTNILCQNKDHLLSFGPNLNSNNSH